MDLRTAMKNILTVLQEIGLKEKTISHNYGRFYRALINRIPPNKETDKSLITGYLLEKYGRNLLELQNYQMSREEQICAHAFRLLLDYLNSEVLPIKESYNRTPNPNDLVVMDEFLSIRNCHGDSDRTLKKKESTIKRFLSIYTLEQFSSSDIHQYLQSFQGGSAYYIKRELDEISKFLGYCFKQHIIWEDFQKLFPYIKASKGSKIPSVYGTDEIRQLLTYFKNRKSRIRLRDYSIILLISIYGFRASDIIAMKCESINFQNGTISIVQSKTAKKICHKLLPHVGNTIVDYILNERPCGTSDWLFLKADGHPMSHPKTIGSIVRNGFLSSDININGRKYGSHALRHSVASELLNNETSIFTIANVLGQTSSETARLYAKVDISHLRLCTLEVPNYK